MIEDLLVPHLFAVLLIFCRVGAGLMVLPGVGESYVSPTIRLMLALSFSVMLTPLMQGNMPTIPDSPATLFVLMMGEILAGLTVGLLCRFIVSTMHIAGMVISFQTGLSMATQFDMTQATQGSLIGNMLTMNAVMMLFVLDLHLVMLRGLADSYSLFIPGGMPDSGDLAYYFANIVDDIFEMGVKLAAPAIVIAFVTNVAAGVLSRLMPSFQVFFIFLSPQILLGFFILLSVYATILLEFTGFFSEHLGAFLDGEVRGPL